MISPSKASHPLPSIGTIDVSSSPWPNPTYGTAAPVNLPTIPSLPTSSVDASTFSSSSWPNRVSLSPEQQLVLNRKRLPNNHDPTNVDRELLPMKVSYLKIDKLALQPKSSSPGINTHALLALGIFLAGACLFFFTYRYARLR